MDDAVAALLAQMTVEEKAALCSGEDFWYLKGNERLDIPDILVTDGPHGLRKQLGDTRQVGFESVPATCFPTASALANSWDIELLREVGVALAEECLEENVGVLLGPGVNIKRSPLCGRNFEYFSEDPYLTGELAVAMIEGIQSQGVGTSLKHFAVNNQEHRRSTIDVRVDERTLREIYLPAFEQAVTRARPWTVMCAYNRVNGEFCSEHPRLLQGILRDEWGFDGVLLTDWGACNDRVAGLVAGQDLEMPGSGGINDRLIAAAVRDGRLPEATLDRAAGRVLALILRCARQARPGFRYDRESHHTLARRAAAASAVLLRNEDALLPLAATTSLAVIGPFAKTPRYQGAGSSQITPWRLDNAWDELNRQFAHCEYAEGFTVEAGDTPDTARINAACLLARQCEVAVIFAGLPPANESEAFDRQHMHLPAAQNELIRRVAAVNPRTVVVLASGAPVELPWAEDVAAIVAAYLGGQAGGPGLVDVLSGRVNPSGRLAETWPLRLRDTPCHDHFPGGPEAVEYREGLYVGYRHYLSAGQAVRYPFGHGLGYSPIRYGELVLSADTLGEHDTLDAHIPLHNEGQHAAVEVVQLYVHDAEATVYRPLRELRAFARVSLAPGETGFAHFRLERRAFAFFNAVSGHWQVESGDFEIQAGASSADIRAVARVQVQAHAPVQAPALLNLREAAPVYYAPSAPARFDEAAFQALCEQGPAMPPTPRSTQRYHLNSTLGELRHTWIGSLLYGAVLKGSAAASTGENDAELKLMMRNVVDNMPLRQVVLYSGGRLNYRIAGALLHILNRDWRALLGLRRTSPQDVLPNQ